MNNPVFVSGNCRCGDITLSIANPPKMMAQCHCIDCQKASGAGHLSIAFFTEGDVTIHGKTKEYTVTTDRGNQSTRYFCPMCGSRMYGINTGRPGIISVPIGCLNDHSWFSPNAVAYTKHREDWDITRTDIPNFSSNPLV